MHHKCKTKWNANYKALSQEKKGWLNIQYRANSNADGYQIQYGMSSNMKGAKYVALA